MTKEKLAMFSRLKVGLGRTTENFTAGWKTIFTKRRLDAGALEELEDLLIASDLGPGVASKVVARLAADRFDKEINPDEIKIALARVVTEILETVANPLEIVNDKYPHVILVVGVNGTGKTTTIGKIAHRLQQDGKSVAIAAADTFRAAAIDQLEIWAERTGATVIQRGTGADPAAVAFEGLQTARAQGSDVLLIDTAGRLQNKAGLMDQLAKITRVLEKIDNSAPHDCILILDATSGQNVLRQVEIFSEVCNVTGLAMTKLDGTARGGVLIAVAERFGLPVYFIGVGESIDDLQPFNPKAFAQAIAGLNE